MLLFFTLFQENIESFSHGSRALEYPYLSNTLIASIATRFFKVLGNRFQCYYWHTHTLRARA